MNAKGHSGLKSYPDIYLFFISFNIFTNWLLIYGYNMNFVKTLNSSKTILIEGGVVERLKTEFNQKVDAHINHAGLIYSNPGVLEKIYRQYIDIGKKYKLPIIVKTPTRKVNYASIKKSAYCDKNIIGDCCNFLNKIKHSYGQYAEYVFIGGLMGCKGDAYSSDNALYVSEAYKFHKNQVYDFVNANIDFLIAGIMPEMGEITGMAHAMAESGLPYVISFMIRPDGCLLDGTPISEAIYTIDKQVNPQPLFYMSNCVHPLNLKNALSNNININEQSLCRFTGIQANASPLSPEQLNNCGVLQQGDFDEMIDEMLLLNKQFGLKLFGGCCGTNDLFIEKLARKISKEIE